MNARLSLGNDAEIARMFGASRQDIKPFTEESASRWIQRFAGHPHAWAIEINGKLAGDIRLDNLDRHDRRATMAIGILDPASLGKGYGGKAIMLLLSHAFTDLELHRIGIRVLAYNERAIRAYQKCGFVIEGRERESALVDGVWHDDIMMGLLEQEFMIRNS